MFFHFTFNYIFDCEKCNDLQVFHTPTDINSAGSRCILIFYNTLLIKWSNNKKNYVLNVMQLSRWMVHSCLVCCCQFINLQVLDREVSALSLCSSVFVASPLPRLYELIPMKLSIRLQHHNQHSLICDLIVLKNTVWSRKIQARYRQDTDRIQAKYRKDTDRVHAYIFMYVCVCIFP